jgi:bacterial/archaeal transporter family protein
VSKTAPQTDASSSSKPLIVQEVKVIEANKIAVEEIVYDESKRARRKANVGSRLPTIILSVCQTLETKWFWYSIASSLCWTAWAFTAKIGSREIPPATMQFISAFGFVLVTLTVVSVKKVQRESSVSGRCYALLSGLLLALGGISLYAAYRTGHNVSMITAMTSLYPVVTFVMALIFLGERLNRVQLLGLGFAAAAVFILSL